MNLALIGDLLSRPGTARPVDSPRLFRATGRVVTPKVEWVEISVKSVLNRVQGMPFNWSINPYRGCSHACVYCAGGDTPILVADSTTKPLGDIRVGDVLYGTLRDGRYRRYVKTPVLAHWSVKKAAYRITLEDGTELIASGDHRFLTDRGWKFVTGTEQGRARRPHLTTRNKLIGVGAFAKPPLKDADYKRGYLCGLIRGDAWLAANSYQRAGRRYTSAFDGGPTSAKPIRAIRTSARGYVEDIQRIIAWPSMPSLSWRKGFLAGIFDAEGSYSQSILRITNTDSALVDWIARGLRQLGFAFAVESRSNGRAKPLHAVRLLGGLREDLRFFHSIAPAIDRKCNITGQALKSEAPLRVEAIEPLGARELFDITTGTGDFIANGVVSHNCFARVTHWYLDQDGVNDWSSRIFVKVNAPQVLRQELARPSWRREQVSLGTATDPYQPAEGKYRLTRQILQALRDFRTPVAIVTKSTMVRRDRDVLRQLAGGPGAFVYFSFTTVDPDLAREIEPDVPPPLQRLEVMRALIDAGVPAGVILAPVLPGLTDDEDHLAAVVKAAREYGARSLSTIVLHLGEVTRQAFFGYLEHKHPDLVPEYEHLYQGKYAPRQYQARVQEVVNALKVRLAFKTTSPERYRQDDNGSKALEGGNPLRGVGAEQLRLF